MHYVLKDHPGRGSGTQSAGSAIRRVSTPGDSDMLRVAVDVRNTGAWGGFRSLKNVEPGWLTSCDVTCIVNARWLYRPNRDEKAGGRWHRMC